MSKVKEIQLSPNIGDHDLHTKLAQTEKFLKKGYTVKVHMIFKGRQIVHFDAGAYALDQFVYECLPVGRPMGVPKLNGKRLSVTIGSKGKK